MKIKSTIQIEVVIDDKVFESKSDFTKEEFVNYFKKEMIEEIERILKDDDLKSSIVCDARIVD